MVAAGACAIAIALLAYAVPDLTVAPLLLLLVIYVTWSFGRVSGGILAAAGAAAEFVSVVLTAPYPSNSFVNLDVVVRVLAYFTAVWLAALFRARYERGFESARVDFVTGARTRQGFYELLDLERRRQRRTRLPLSVAYLDCDNFKTVNDTYGHAAGDEVLRTIVSTARSKLRATDVIGRVGGDEFAITLPETDAAGATTALRELSEALSKVMSEHEWNVGFSIGLGTFAYMDASPEELVSISDALMFEAKRQGKNRIVQREYGDLDAASRARNMHVPSGDLAALVD